MYRAHLLPSVLLHGGQAGGSAGQRLRDAALESGQQLRDDRTQPTATFEIRDEENRGKFWEIRKLYFSSIRLPLFFSLSIRGAVWKVTFLIGRRTGES
jgi:hypothetical protein